MKHRVSVVLVAVCAALAAASGALAGGEQATTYYLSLGDSLAQSFQPPSDFQHGYAEQLHGLLSADEPKLKLVKLGCGGETTLSMIDPYLPHEGRGARFFCSFPHASQLAEAVNFLHAHKGSVRLVTITVGANDLFQFGEQGPATIGANLPRILAALRAAAGPGIPIVGMNYYDPFLAPVWFETHSLAAVAAEAAAVAAFNDLLEAIYAAAAVPVADVESAFSTTDLTLVGGTPLNVLRACEWTWICAGGDIHANTAGYGVIARAFLAVI